MSESLDKRNQKSRERRANLKKEDPEAYEKTLKIERARKKRQYNNNQNGRNKILAVNKQWKAENPEAGAKNWGSWVDDEFNRSYRRKYFQTRAIAQREGRQHYFNKKIYVQWLESGADENSPLLRLDAKDFPPQRRS